MESDPTGAHPITEVVEIRPTATDENAGADYWAHLRNQALLATEVRDHLEEPLSDLRLLTKEMHTHGQDLEYAPAIRIVTSSELRTHMERLAANWQDLDAAVEEQDGERGEKAVRALHATLVQLRDEFDGQESVVDWLDRLSLSLARVALDAYDFRSAVGNALNAGWSERSTPRVPRLNWATARVNEG